MSYVAFYVARASSLVGQSGYVSGMCAGLNFGGLRSAVTMALHATEPSQHAAPYVPLCPFEVVLPFVMHWHQAGEARGPLIIDRNFL